VDDFLAPASDVNGATSEVRSDSNSQHPDHTSPKTPWFRVRSTKSCKTQGQVRMKTGRTSNLEVPLFVLTEGTPASPANVIAWVQSISTRQANSDLASQACLCLAPQVYSRAEIRRHSLWKPVAMDHARRRKNAGALHHISTLSGGADPALSSSRHPDSRPGHRDPGNRLS
jgi:hypothetical protein